MSHTCVHVSVDRHESVSSLFYIIRLYREVRRVVNRFIYYKNKVNNVWREQYNCGNVFDSCCNSYFLECGKVVGSWEYTVVCSNTIFSYIYCSVKQGIIDNAETETLPLSFVYVWSKELSACTLNGIAVSAPCVLSTPLVLHARLNNHPRRMQTNRPKRSKTY